MTVTSGANGNVEVLVNHETLKRQFERQGTGYAVQLAGNLDERWAQVFRILRMDTPECSSFRLEPTKGTVSFTCMAGDGPAEIFGMLEHLDALVELVNKRAQSETGPNLDSTLPDAEAKLPPALPRPSR